MKPEPRWNLRCEVILSREQRVGPQRWQAVDMKRWGSKYYEIVLFCKFINRQLNAQILYILCVRNLLSFHRPMIAAFINYRRGTISMHSVHWGWIYLSATELRITIWLIRHPILLIKVPPQFWPKIIKLRTYSMYILFCIHRSAWFYTKLALWWA
jgi:hypothetical protein